jgi:threonine-phosphate decarboxylase
VALREAIACRFSGLEKGNVVVGNGSTELVYLFADVFLKRGDVAVVAAPTFGEYENAVRRAGGEPRFVRLSPEFRVEADAFVRGMRGAKAVFLCNPNNPTSMLMRDVDLVEIVEAALGEGVLVFLDEDFIEFVDDEKRHSLVGRIGEFRNLFVLRTFTKFYGLTGLRVGFGVGCKEIVEVLANAKMPWNVNSLAQVAAVAALADEEHAQKTREVVRVERQFLLRELAGLEGFRVFPADANYVFLDVRRSGFTAAQLKEKMLRLGVLIRDCSSFQGLDAFFVRVAVRTRGENERLLAAFRKVLSGGV